MATIKRFEDIESWKLGKELCALIGNYIDEGKFKKNYRLIDQMEGSSGSIMVNIAEGFERGTKGEFILFPGYSKGSSGEFRSQLYRALNRGYLTQKEFDGLYDLVVKISGLLQKFIEYLHKTNIA
ncbi:MAG: four helix bundle protein [Chitinophagaceae bacterium]